MASKVWKIHNLLVALLVFAENFNLPSGREDKCNSRGTDISVGGLRLVTAFDTSNDRGLFSREAGVAI